MTTNDAVNKAKATHWFFAGKDRWHCLTQHLYFMAKGTINL
jgi:hypothetical protein